MNSGSTPPGGDGRDPPRPRTSFAVARLRSSRRARPLPSRRLDRRSAHCASAAEPARVFCPPTAASQPARARSRSAAASQPGRRARPRPRPDAAGCAPSGRRRAAAAAGAARRSCDRRQAGQAAAPPVAPERGRPKPPPRPRRPPGPGAGGAKAAAAAPSATATSGAAKPDLAIADRRLASGKVGALSPSAGRPTRQLRHAACGVGAGTAGARRGRA